MKPKRWTVKNKQEEAFHSSKRNWSLEENRFSCTLSGVFYLSYKRVDFLPPPAILQIDSFLEKYPDRKKKTYMHDLYKKTTKTTKKRLFKLREVLLRQRFATFQNLENRNIFSYQINKMIYHRIFFSHLVKYKRIVMEPRQKLFCVHGLLQGHGFTLKYIKI